MTELGLEILCDYSTAFYHANEKANNFKRYDLKDLARQARLMGIDEASAISGRISYMNTYIEGLEAWAGMCDTESIRITEPLHSQKAEQFNTALRSVISGYERERHAAIIYRNSLKKSNVKVSDDTFKERVERAKKVPIADFIGKQPVRRNGKYLVYHSPLRADNDPSFYVDTSEWNNARDWGTGTTYSNINLYMLIYSCDFKQAIEELARY